MVDMAGKYINREKASSHPLAAGGVFEGVVKSFTNGRPVVFVKQLKCTYADVNFIGNSTRTKLVKDDQVLCTFIDNESSTLYILGAYNKKQDTFVGKEKYNALIDALEAALGLSATAFDTHKQNN
jgi:hypothetical protein